MPKDQTVTERRIFESWRARACTAGLCVGTQIFLFGTGLAMPVSLNSAWIAALIVLPFSALLTAISCKKGVVCGRIMSRAALILLALTLLANAVFAAAALVSFAEQTLLEQGRTLWIAAITVTSIFLCALSSSGISWLCFALRWTLPVLMLTFGGVSLVSPLTNVLAGTAASSAVLCVGLGTAFAAVPLLKLLTPWLFLSTGLLTRYLFAVCHALGKWSIAYVNAEGGEVRFAVACILLLLGITGFLYYSSPEVPAVLRQTVASICTIILLTSVFSHQLIDRDMVTVTFPTVGNGSMAVVSCRGNSALVGCGGDYRAGRAVSDCMSRDGSRFLSCVLAPRGEGNTDSALRELSEELHPSRIVRGTGKVQLYPGVMVAIRPSYAILDVYSVRLLFAFMPAEAGRSRECGADLTYVRSYKPALYGDDGEKYSLEPSGIRVLIRGQRYKVERLR